MLHLSVLTRKKERQYVNLFTTSLHKKKENLFTLLVYHFPIGSK